MRNTASVPTPPDDILQTLMQVPEFFGTVSHWANSGYARIGDVRIMMRYAQDIVRKKKSSKWTKTRDALELLAGQYVEK